MKALKSIFLIFVLFLSSSCLAKKVSVINPVDFSKKDPAKFNYELWPNVEFEESSTSFLLVKNIQPHYLEKLNQITFDFDQYVQWLEKALRSESPLRPGLDEVIFMEKTAWLEDFAKTSYKAEDVIPLRGKIYGNVEAIQQAVVIFKPDGQSNLLLILCGNWKQGLCHYFYWTGHQWALVPHEIDQYNFTPLLSKFLYDRTGKLIIFLP